MKESILPDEVKPIQEPVKKSDDLSVGVVIGLVFLFLGVISLATPFVIESRADAARDTVKYKIAAARKKNPNIKIQMSDYITQDDIDAVRLDSEMEIPKRLFFVGSIFVLFPLGIIFILFSVTGVSDMSIGEIAASGAVGYVGYKLIKKALK